MPLGPGPKFDDKKEKKLEDICAAVHMKDNKAIILFRDEGGGIKIELTREEDGETKVSYSHLGIGIYIRELERLPKPYLMGY